MKRTQLEQLPIQGFLILIDESQDMDACQIDWAARQQYEKGSIVYVVGDPAQAIYGFRGAKAQNLMDLPSTESPFLTGSFDLANRLPMLPIVRSMRNSSRIRRVCCGIQLLVAGATKIGILTIERRRVSWRALLLPIR